MDSDDEPLLSKKSKTKAPTVLRKPPKASETALGEPEDSDVPLGAKLAKKKHTFEKRAEKEAKIIRKEGEKASAAPKKKKAQKGDSEDDEEPVVKSKKQQSNGASTSTKKKANGVKKDEDDEDDTPLVSKKLAKKAKAEMKLEKVPPVKKSPKVKTVKKEDTEQDQEAEEQEEEYRWWEDPAKHDGIIKWTTLEHAGVVFPPPYEPLPKNVQMRYDGVPVTMAPAAEEIAGFFGGMLNSTHNVDNPTFQKNFFADFIDMLNETGGARDKGGRKVNIKEFARCDFKSIFEYYDTQRAQKKSLSNAEKKKIKADKDAAEAPYMYCTWDGRKQKVGNFRVEPPALFRGRGEHPKTGKVKKRVDPEQIIINIGKEAAVPAPPEGHRWKEVKHDQEGTWLAMWQENINGAYKYVMLAANSDVKGQSDHKKFEKARELKVRTAVISSRSYN